MATEVDHADLTGAALHPPLGTSESASALAIADVTNAILIEDSSGYDIARVNLVNDQIMIGSADRPIALKVYDAAINDEVNVLDAGPVAPRGIQSTTPAGTIQGLWQFQGDITDDSANSYDLTLAGSVGGVARYAPIHCGGGSRLGFVFLGDTWLTRSTSSSANLDIGGALTIEALICPLNLTQSSSSDSWLTQYAGIITLSDTSFSSPVSNARYQLATGLASASVAYLAYAHETAAPALASTFDTAPALPGLLQHLCVTRDSAGTAINIYVNGVLRKTDTLSAGPGSAGDTLQIGTLNANAGAGYTFRGWMGGLAVIDAELSAAQVLARANYALGL